MLSRLVSKMKTFCMIRQLDRNLNFFSVNLKETIIFYGNHKNIANVKFNRERKKVKTQKILRPKQITTTVGLSEMSCYSFAIYFHCHVAEDRRKSRDQNLRQFSSV